VPEQAQGCALVPGMAIYGTFRDVVRWDLGGQINGEVTRPVVSPERPDWVLIPEGATLVGYARAEDLKMGMDMAPTPVWDHVWWIDSDTGQRRMRNLHDASGADIAGVNGAGGEVNQHWGTVAALVAAATVTDFLSSISVSIGDSESVNARIGGSSAGRILEGVATKMLDIRPTITTPAGTQFIVKPQVPIRMC
jgi:type IV secretory pathway VirB10-like protein